jgi:hypothetical protein
MALRLVSSTPATTTASSGVISPPARQLDAAAIGYRRSDNKITAVDDSAAVAALGERFAHTDWPPVLERQAALVNPLLPDIERAGSPGYWWVIDPVRVRQRRPVH